MAIFDTINGHMISILGLQPYDFNEPPRSMVPRETVRFVCEKTECYALIDWIRYEKWHSSQPSGRYSASKSIRAELECGNCLSRCANANDFSKEHHSVYVCRWRIVSDSIEFFRRFLIGPRRQATTWRTCHCSRTKNESNARSRTDETKTSKVNATTLS